MYTGVHKRCKINAILLDNFYPPAGEDILRNPYSLCPDANEQCRITRTVHEIFWMDSYKNQEETRRLTYGSDSDHSTGVLRRLTQLR